MFARFEQHWRQFKEAPPGARFEQYHKRRQRGRSSWQRALAIGRAILIIGLGLVLLPAPGPGSIVVVLGAALIGQEWLWFARVLDRSDLLLRKSAAWSRQAWRRSPAVVRALVVIATATLLAAVGFAAYMLIEQFARSVG